MSHSSIADRTDRILIARASSSDVGRARKAVPGQASSRSDAAM